MLKLSLTLVVILFIFLYPDRSIDLEAPSKMNKTADTAIFIAMSGNWQEILVEIGFSETLSQLPSDA